MLRDAIGQSVTRALVAGAVLGALVFLPTLVRAGQALLPGQAHARQADGLHKSIDTPPDPAEPAVDRTPAEQLRPSAADRRFRPTLNDEDPRGLRPDVTGLDAFRGPPPVASAHR